MDLRLLSIGIIYMIKLFQKMISNQNDIVLSHIQCEFVW